MYEVVWDVENEVFGGHYSLHKYCETRREADELVKKLHNDFLVSNIETFEPEWSQWEEA